jgi:hypothetical protein
LAALAAGVAIAGISACGGDNKATSTTTAAPENTTASASTTTSPTTPTTIVPAKVSQAPCTGGPAGLVQTVADNVRVDFRFDSSKLIIAAYLHCELVANAKNDKLVVELGKLQASAREGQSIDIGDAQYQLFVLPQDQDPLTVAETLAKSFPDDIAPNYVMATGPGWVFGPGDTPSATTAPSSTPSTAGPTIGLVDTGNPIWNASPLTAPSTVSVDGIPDTFVDGAIGHGTFIASLYSRVFKSWNLVEAQAPLFGISVPGSAVNSGAATSATTDFALGATLVNTFTKRPVEYLGLSLGTYDPAGNESSSASTPPQNKPITTKFALLQLHKANNKMTVIAAAGNDGWANKFYPAAFSVSPEFTAGCNTKMSCWLVAAASSGKTGRADPFSNYGPWVTVVANGENTVGWRPDVTNPNTGASSGTQGWWTWTGTSFAVPCVIGAVTTGSASISSIVTTAVGVTQAALQSPTVGCPDMH